MLIVSIWRWLCGYVVIQAEGLSLEKLINLCMVRGITLWRVDRYSATHMEACISMRGFYRLREVLPRLSCRVTVIAKKGLPMILLPLKKRMAFAMGVVLCMAVIYFGTSLVWDIQVFGTDKLPQGAVEERLAQYGVTTWIWKNQVSTKKVESQLLLDFPEMAWVNVHFNGVNLIVEVVEAVQPPDEVPRDVPANVIARKEGLIESILVLEGKAMVEKGQRVEQGDMLISGTIPAPEGERIVRANGIVMARIWYKGQAKIDLMAANLVRTGRMVEQTYIMFGDDFEMKIRGDAPNFAYFEREEIRYPLFGEHMIAPLSWVVVRYHEMAQGEYQSKLDSYVETCAREAFIRAEKLVPEDVEIIDKQIESSMIEGDQLIVTVYIETGEDIAQVRRMSP